MIDWIKRHRWWLFAIILVGALLASVQLWRGSREHSQDAAILAASARYGVHAALIKAVVWRESWFNPSATGQSGEVGLMQIMKDTASDWAAAEHARGFMHRQLYDPEKNLQCGAWYLRRLLVRYQNTDNPIIYALAAYNAGPGNVAKWASGGASTNSAAFLKQMRFPGTRDYVRSVSGRFEYYRRTFPPRSWKPGPEGARSLDRFKERHPDVWKNPRGPDLVIVKRRETPRASAGFSRPDLRKTG